MVSKFRLFIFLKYFLSLKRVRLVDNKFYLSSEASTRLRLYYYDFSSELEREDYVSRSKRNFKVKS